MCVYGINRTVSLDVKLICPEGVIDKSILVYDVCALDEVGWSSADEYWATIVFIRFRWLCVVIVLVLGMFVYN